VERGPVGAPGSLRSPVLSGRALRALSGTGTPIGQRLTNPAKRLTETPFLRGAPPRAAPRASRRRAPRQRGALTSCPFPPVPSGTAPLYPKLDENVE